MIKDDLILKGNIISITTNKVRFLSLVCQMKQAQTGCIFFKNFFERENYSANPKSKTEMKMLDSIISSTSKKFEKSKVELFSFDFFLN